ncbi:polysaccharide deacetylase family protein [Actinoplanes subtropicus]|uniref:polysaccharide deacetylase family protein n=1 Tax=Actinoplanes subtropicus TaxID=543632 RepID=UPI0007C5B1DB|nr:polysaccharide deacetylase family protein [Actinoplanes subtropicus]
MSPLAPPVADRTGRHRRPESLADEPRPVPVYRVSTLLESDTWVPGPRSARHHRPASQRRTASHRAAAPTRPPVTGSHRAPGTIPLESWLLMGKKRQQILLASLVAVGLVLIAVPGARSRDGLDAINAAARATGNHAQQQKGGTAATDPAKPKPTPAASAPADVPVVPSTGPAKPKNKDAGPANSLRVTGSTAVALTFDDGPDPAQTPQILALLDKYQIKATFCLVGQNVVKHPEIVREIVADGHTLCNHTWNHSLTIGKDKPEQIRADLARTDAAIEAAAPGVKIPFFRAPGGNFTDRLVDVAAADGMTSLYWQVDPQDWLHKTGETDVAHTARVVAEIKKDVRPGAIVLSHDFNQPDTIAAYAKLLPWFKANFTLGIPGEPAAPAATTSPAATPTPTDTATPEPSPSASVDPAAAPATGDDSDAR